MFNIINALTESSFFNMSNLLPILLKISNTPILIVGGGKVAMRKAAILFNFTENITVVAKKINKNISDLGINCIEKEYELPDLKHHRLVYACTNNRNINEQIKNDCKRNGILINIADNPENSDFYSPALYVWANMTVAVSSKQRAVKKAIEYRNNIKDFINNKRLKDISFNSNNHLEMKTQKDVFLPITLNTTEKKILIIGGKTEALKKIKILSKYVQNIHVLASSIHPEVRQNVQKCIQKSYQSNDIKDYFLIYDCTGNKNTNNSISKHCKQKNILLNVHDRPEHSAFISPAVYQNKQVLIAIGSNSEDVKKSIFWRNQIKKYLTNDEY